MAVVGADQWSHESEQREVLPDGTLHNKIVLTRRDSGALAETLETFEQPPTLHQDTEDIVEVLPDGTKVVRRVAMSRMVHSIKTRHESFDESSGRKVEEQFEVEEVVPNTSSAFDAGVDSDYEDEQREKKVRNLSLEQDMEEIEEVLPDGTRVKRKVELSRVVHVTRGQKDALDPRTGNIQEVYPSEEVVPGTISAFEAGQDSDTEDGQTS
ncbi:uncharacterized protein LOC143276734 [Babylonia areolata]|uniref:uncharacterized protein LOC143276734 n=1 Tax=Babylonia areolata TaxID=304850 RepID=UPI003FCF8E03